MKNYKLKVTKKQSRKIQKLCFKLGITWCCNSKDVKHLWAKRIYIKDEGLSTNVYKDLFDKDSSKLIKPKKLIKKLKKKIKKKGCKNEK